MSEAVVDAKSDKLVRLAVFDFDGTSIDGNSPVVLVRKLTFKRELGLSYVARILLWAAAYKMHLPQNEAWVRGLVFSAFEGEDVTQVDNYLREFYDQHLECIFRPQAHEAMSQHRQEGCLNMLVSATFEPLVEQCMLHHPVDFQISTQMETTADGRYTRKVAGLPVEGDQKLIRITQWADAKFGKGKWVIEHAYGDHYSDKTLLDAARHPHPVCPDHTLTRYAKAKGWNVLEW